MNALVTWLRVIDSCLSIINGDIYEEIEDVPKDMGMKVNKGSDY